MVQTFNVTFRLKRFLMYLAWVWVAATFSLGYGSQPVEAIPQACLEIGRRFDAIERADNLVSDWRLFLGLDKVESLSRSVYKVPLKNGGFGVVRVTSSKFSDAILNDGVFEQFAAGVARQLDILLPLPKKFNASFQLRRALLKVEKRIDAKKAIKENAPTTLVPFYEQLELGADYIKRVGGVNKVPPSIRQQLADLWGLYTVLGIPDFHAGNWMTDGRRVIPIDLALRSGEFAKGTETIWPAFQQSPLSFDMMRRGEHQNWVNAMSPGMIEKLTNLDQSNLLQLARKIDPSITPLQIQGILKRSKKIMSLRSDPKVPN